MPSTLIGPSMVPLLEPRGISSLEASSELIPHDVLYINAKSSLVEPKASLRESEPKPRGSLMKTVGMLLMVLVRIYSSSLIIDPPFLGILEQLIGVDNLSELLFGPRILLVSIRMIPSGSPLESCLYLFLTCIAIDP